jgi:hypothetical protein
MRTTTLVVSALAALALACGGDDGPPDDGVCVGVAPPWIRAEPSAGGAVTINEVMYHPRGDQPAWIELYNPFAFDADLSGFRLGGAIDFTFPDGTRIAPDGYLVIASAAMPGALGPFGGALPRGPGAVELWNNAGRLLDAVAYGVDEPWPVAADGSGASLAKRAPDDASGPAERWIASARVGGTPGAANVAVASPPATRALVPAGSTWRYLASPAPSGWQGPDFDDRAWAAAPRRSGPAIDRRRRSRRPLGSPPTTSSRSTSAAPTALACVRSVATRSATGPRPRPSRSPPWPRSICTSRRGRHQATTVDRRC